MSRWQEITKLGVEIKNRNSKQIYKESVKEELILGENQKDRQTLSQTKLRWKEEIQIKGLRTTGTEEIQKILKTYLRNL